MRWSLFIFAISIFQAQAISGFAQKTEFSLSFENASVATVLSKIEDESNFYFMCNRKLVDLDRMISIQVENQSIEKVLAEIFKGTNVEYVMTSKQIVLTPGKSNSQTHEASQQSITITGKVTDSSGSPLPGVSVVVKSNTTGTITDAEGKYNLGNVPANATLMFSFVGMKTQEIPVAGKSIVNVTMIEETVGIEEVVAIGYGSVRKSVLTGAISTVPMGKNQPVATQRVDQMLQGRASGVLVLNTDGSPGGNTTIRIRGMNSIQGGNNALIVIDGFQGGDLQSLNPNDISSIEILKDASATTIYGAQGANGVILIETKKGKTDTPVINYSSEFGLSNIIKGGVKMMGAADFAREMNRYAMLNDLDMTPVPVFTDTQIAEFEKTGGTNWMNEVFRTSLTQTHQLSLSGRTKKVNYFVSGSYLDQNGVLINSGYKRYSLRTNINADINNWLSFGLNWDGSQQDRFGARFGSQVPWHSNPVLGAILFPPTIPVYDEDGNYSEASSDYGEPGIENPVASAREPEINSKTTLNNLNINLEFKLLKGLSFKMTGGARISNWVGTQFYNDKTITGRQFNGVGRANNSSSKNYQNSNILSYVNDIGKHHINAILVGEVKYSQSYDFGIDNSNFTVQETGVYNLGGASKQLTSSSFSERKINSALTRVNYGYDNKYTFSFSYRADGSSVFGSNNKWAYFPSVSAGWRLSEEEVIKDLGIFNNLMIRGSWGKTGNQAISPYRTLARINSVGFYPWDGGDSSNIAFQISSASNPNLKWESTAQTNFGLDISLLRGKLRLTTEYYKKKTEDLLLSRELPRSTGLSNIIDNVGSMENEGWEFTLDGDFKFNVLRWTTGLSLTASTTKVLDLGEDEYIAYSASGSGAGTELPNMWLRVGERFGQIMGFGYEGTWKTSEAEIAGKYGQMPGDPKYTDVDGDYRIDYDHDWKVIGNVLPDFIFGWTNQLNYKNWELTFLFQGTYGNDIFNAARVRREYENGYSTDKLNRWTVDNQNTDIPALISDKTREDYRLDWDAAHPDQPFVNTVVLPSRGVNMTSRYLEDGSYIRLKNITLSYTLPINKYFNNMRIYFTGTNLMTITKYSGWDPEVSSYTDNDAQLGTDYNNYPNSRTYSLGVNLAF
ncbi:MAG: TonB-dependent receptor [Prolixibacteraceae bacterium]|jgi:TonB-linked SusC/RagA family outer membrane protein|nr:TonB-dependent receptor [Prolixibacteraceae bacterium]